MNINMLRDNLLYVTMIGNDGRMSKEPTLFGIVLIGIGFCAAFALIIFLAF
jgi:hypothetical protein